MKAYLANGTVSLLASNGAIAVTLDASIASAIYKDYESLEDEGRDCCDEQWEAGDLKFQYFEDGRVALFRFISPEQSETIAEGQAAERLRLNWDVLAAFSKANPTCDKSALLAFQA
jgi:hypothetical protein